MYIEKLWSNDGKTYTHSAKRVKYKVNNMYTTSDIKSLQDQIYKYFTTSLNWNYIAAVIVYSHNIYLRK